MCDQYEYRIPLDNGKHNIKLNLSEFPDLEIVYVSSYMNNGVNLKVNGVMTTIKLDDEDIIGNYKIKGVRMIDNDLVILVKKCKVYNVGQPFIVEFPDNPSTGYSWNIKLSPGLELLSSHHSTNCRKGLVGCGGVRSFILVGHDKGDQQLMATYGQEWNKSTLSTHVYQFVII